MCLLLQWLSRAYI